MNEKARQSLLSAKEFLTQDVMFWLTEAQKQGSDTSRAEYIMFELIYELNKLIHNNNGKKDS